MTKKTEGKRRKRKRSGHVSLMTKKLNRDTQLIRKDKARKKKRGECISGELMTEKTEIKR